jgi:tetratricopeptide (TPR) repeat protein
VLRPLLLTCLLLSAGAEAQGDPGAYTRALAAYNAQDFETAAPGFFALASSEPDPQLRARAEYYLASSLQGAGFPFAAFLSFTPLVRSGPTHPYHLKAVEALLALQELLGDDALIPTVLSGAYDTFSEGWRRLPPEALGRVNYLMGRVASRKGLLDEARLFLEAVPRANPTFARAQALLGVTLADPRLPAADAAARQRNGELALEAFGRALEVEADPTSTVHQVALLGVARVSYGLGDFAEAVRRYDQVPRYSRFWDQALLENGLARFQNDDPGGALGSLQGLAAPQLAGAFEPEAEILAATVYYFACLYPQALASLARFDARYPPLAEQLKAWVEGPAPAPRVLLEQLRHPERASLPAAVVAWARSGQRVAGLLGLLAEVARERQALRVHAWAGTPLAAEVTASLEQNGATLERVAAGAALARLKEAARSVRGFSDQADIIRFEVAKAEKEAAEAGQEPRVLLDAQTLLRPKLPSAGWEHWPFEGEYWRDEVGFYRYTLKRGCSGAR